MSAQFPPGPKSLLGLNLARGLQRDVLAFSVGLARQYGDVVAFRIGSVRFFQFTHPEQTQEILVKQAKKFHKPTRLKQIFGKWDGEGLLLSEGDLWVRQRRLVQQAFQPRRVQAYAQKVLDVAQRTFTRWTSGAVVDMLDEVHRLTLEIVCQTLFGFDMGDHAEMRHMVQELQDTALIEFGRLLPLPDWLPIASKRRMRTAIRYLNQLLDEIIRQRRSSREDAGDLLSMLLFAVDHEGDGHGMSDQLARDEAMTLLLAGHETTATTLAWTTWLLAVHPEIQEQTAAEVIALLGDRLPTADDVPRLTAVDRVIKESMRIYPAVYFTAREAVEPVEIAGCQLRPGDQAHLLPYIVQRDARWFAEPERFDPQRFTPEREAALPPCAYFPFGAGPRACIGRGMAMMEATLFIAALLQRYRLAPAPGQGQPTAMAQVSLHPQGPMKLTVTERTAGESASTPRRPVERQLG